MSFNAADTPLNLAVHPKARGWQYTFQLIANDNGKHLGIIGARDFPFPKGDGKGRIFIAESTDLTNWTNGRIAFEPSGVAGAYCGEQVLDPFVMTINGRKFMWFAGKCDGLPWQIGCVTSTDDFRTIEATNSPVVPVNFSGTGKDTPNITDDFSAVNEDGRILFVYNGGVHNDVGFAGSCEGDPMDPANYRPIAEIHFDRHPPPDNYAGNMNVYRAKEGGYYMLRCAGVADCQDVYLYASDDFVNWSFTDTLLQASEPGNWNAALYKPFLEKVGDELYLSYAGTEIPIWPAAMRRREAEASGSKRPNESFRCGLATARPATPEKDSKGPMKKGE